MPRAVSVARERRHEAAREHILDEEGIARRQRRHDDHAERDHGERGQREAAGWREAETSCVAHVATRGSAHGSSHSAARLATITTAAYAAAHPSTTG